MASSSRLFIRHSPKNLSIPLQLHENESSK